MSSAAGLWRRTPPAIFPPILGLLGLGLAWRAGAPAFGLSRGLGDLILGASTLLFLFALVAWLAKPLRRPAVAVEELRSLPGRAGLAAMTMAGMLAGAALVPHAPGLALGVTVAALVAHAALALAMAALALAGSGEARVVTPVWHLVYVGFIVGALALVPLGHAGAARGIFLLTLAAAAAIWAASLWQLATRVPPAPLRPLLAIHLAPASLFATVAALLGMTGVAAGFALLAAAILLALLAGGRWIVQAGFSPLWGAFTFPLAAFASALFAVGQGGGALRLAAGIALVAATLAIPPIAVRVLQAWARGGLAERTNAARA